VTPAARGPTENPLRALHREAAPPVPDSGYTVSQESQQDYNHGMGYFKSLKRFFGKRTPVATGITIILLQRRMESFSTERLQAAMESGWRTKHHSVSFFATNLHDEGAVLKLGKMFITMLFSDRRVGIDELGARELPHWAEHSAHASLSYKCPGGIPAGKERDQLYALLGLLAAELLDGNVSGLLFVDEQILIPNTPELSVNLRSGYPQNPVALENKLNFAS
jgi:hypothetical protein